MITKGQFAAITEFLIQNRNRLDDLRLDNNEVLHVYPGEIKTGEPGLTNYYTYEAFQSLDNLKSRITFNVNLKDIGAILSKYEKDIL